MFVHKEQIKDYNFIESSSMKLWNRTLGVRVEAVVQKKEYFIQQVKLAVWNKIEL